MMDTLEPRIRPLVEALNATEIVRTFSSCEGHFKPEEQTIVDRNHADVRFVPAEGASILAVETLLAYLLTSFKNSHGVLPVNARGYRLYTPIDTDAVDETFVLELRPFNRFDPPDRKRTDIDRAISQVVRILEKWPGERTTEE